MQNQQQLRKVPDRTLIDDFWKIFYCPADRNHKLVTKFRYSKHIMGCNSLLKQKRFECEFTNAHQFFREIDLQMHKQICVFNQQPNFEKYLILYEETYQKEIQNLKQLYQQINQDNKIKQKDFLKSPVNQINQNNSILIFNDNLILELQNCENMQQKRQIIQVKKIFDIKDFLQYVQQDFRNYDFFTIQKNLKLKFKRFVPVKKDLLNMNYKTSSISKDIIKILNNSFFIVQVQVNDELTNQKLGKDLEESEELYLISNETHIFGSLLLDDLQYCVIKIQKLNELQISEQRERLEDEEKRRAVEQEGKVNQLIQEYQLEMEGKAKEVLFNRRQKEECHQRNLSQLEQQHHHVQTQVESLSQEYYHYHDLLSELKKQTQFFELEKQEFLENKQEEVNQSVVKMQKELETQLAELDKHAVAIYLTDQNQLTEQNIQEYKHLTQQSKTQLEAILHKISNLKKEQRTTSAQTSQCHFCYINPIQVLYFPCKHILSCQDCETFIHNTHCLHCTLPIHQKLLLHLNHPK